MKNLLKFYRLLFCLQYKTLHYKVNFSGLSTFKLSYLSMSKSTEQCLFCGWNRKNCWQSIRFYNIPKDPGLKKVRWLQIFGERKVTHRDRVSFAAASLSLINMYNVF